MGPFFVKRRMKDELGESWLEFFQNFSIEPYAAASLGQVHKAITQEGQLVACKLQYPDMMQVVESDLKQLQWISSLYHSFYKALDTTLIQKELRIRLQEELNYQHEAQNIERFEKIFQNHPFICIPHVIPHLSTQHLLTMSWAEGRSILDYIESSQEFRDSLGKLLFYAWYHPFYHHGVLHGDPHPGNYRVDESGALTLLDFGCVRIYDRSFIRAVLDLYEGLRDNNTKKIEAAYEQWGFKNLTRDLIETLNEWARLLYDPLLDDRVRPIQPNFSGSYGWEVACRVHEKLRLAGGICPPQEFMLMDRASVGIGGVLMRLKVEHNWHRLFESLIERL
jgi:predicted unusual protein kinase regulating ubiquinone biosynthesis (AarF/ABC1/UbiB family)